MSDPLKDSFNRVKEDILSLQEQINLIFEELNLIKRTLDRQTVEQTVQQIIPTHLQHISNSQNHDLPLDSLKPPISYVSTGNRGVPTDRQTNQQTDRQTQKFVQYNENPSSNPSDITNILTEINNFKDNIKRNFQNLTAQEFLIFSTLYQLESEGNEVDYKMIAKKLSLSESSIRDYIGKIITKRVPVDKRKLNNKKIILSVSNLFRKFTTLDSIQTLRE
jgi:hypothetical protein